MNDDLLGPIRVKLLTWKIIGDQTLELFFQKVPLFTTRRSFQEPGFPVSVFDDFGYIKLVLKGKMIGKSAEGGWLSRYVDDDQIFLEEETRGELTFWEGEYEDGYDWMSSMGLSFNSKDVTFLPLSNDEWKAKYVSMALGWEKYYHERHDLIHHSLLKQFVGYTQRKVDALMPGSSNPELNQFKIELKRDLDYWVKSYEERLRDIEKAYARQAKEEPDTQQVEDEATPQQIQAEINEQVEGFWQKLRNFFK